MVQILLPFFSSLPSQYTSRFTTKINKPSNQTSQTKNLFFSSKVKKTTLHILTRGCCCLLFFTTQKNKTKTVREREKTAKEDIIQCWLFFHSFILSNKKKTRIHHHHRSIENNLSKFYPFFSFFFRCNYFLDHYFLFVFDSPS